MLQSTFKCILGAQLKGRRLGVPGLTFLVKAVFTVFQVACKLLQIHRRF